MGRKPQGTTVTTTPPIHLQVSAILREECAIAVGTPIYEFFPDMQLWYRGAVARLPSARTPTYKVTYADNTSIECSELEVLSIQGLGGGVWGGVRTED